MKKIIVGCPYTSMANIEEALADSNKNDIFLINSNEVRAINKDSIFVGEKPKEYNISDFSASFLRYPYDLIPPHSGTFIIREEMEFYKTIALLFNDISINSLSSTWVLRNRMYSLLEAERLGVNTAASILLKNNASVNFIKKKSYAVKAAGNCFVTEDMDTESEEMQSFLCVEEEDNGDRAAIFSASLMNMEEIGQYIKLFGTVYLQESVISSSEYRCYIIGDTCFTYKRDKCNSFDKSTAAYNKTNFSFSVEIYYGLKNLMKKYSLGYLCFDLICTNKGKEVVIDINPYGSMPNYKKFPDPSICLLALLSAESKA